MIASLTISFLYLGQLVFKVSLAERYAKPHRRAHEPHICPSVSILQPILSGDPKLEDTLQSNLLNIQNARFIWLVDTDDEPGIIICEELRKRHSEKPITIISCSPPPQGVNPKSIKLAIGLRRVDTDFLIVLDDDTQLTVKGLHALLDGLLAGSALSTGLPHYQAAKGRWSQWLAEFVNSAAVLTYLPSLSMMQPVSINGMCYAMRTEDAREHDVFQAIQSSLTDDLALAKLVTSKGLRIHQTIKPHKIATSVDSISSLASILHRWFVFARLLVGQAPLSMRALIGAAYAAPPLLLWMLAVLAPSSTKCLAILTTTIAARAVIINLVQKRYLATDYRHRASASLLLELIQPILLISAYAKPIIKWRKRRILVRDINDFEYL